MIKRTDANGNVKIVTNIRKPRKWRRYEYLENSGGLYIDSGVQLSLTDKFEFETEFTYHPADGTAHSFYGTDSYVTGFMAQYHYTSNNLYPFYIANVLKSPNNITVTAGSNVYSKTIIDIPNKTWSFTCNNTLGNGTYDTLITDTTSTVKIYKGHSYTPYKAKCYYFKIKKNDTLVRHFVPAEYNGLYGMWDLVEDKFYPNAGTGTFTVGPEIKNYDEIDEVRKASSILPAGVELYDYILSSGTQWLVSGIYTADGDFVTKIDATLISRPSNSYTSFFGCDGNLQLGVNVDGKANKGNATSSSVFYQNNTRYLIEAKFSTIEANTYYYINGTDTGLKRATASGSVNQIFNSSSVYGISAKMHRCTILRNNNIIRNFIPCTYLGEPGMWDTVENKFYRNQGTGQFTLGNKITLKEYEYLATTDLLSINNNIKLTEGHTLAYDIIFKYDATSTRRLMGSSPSGVSYFGVNANNKYEKVSSVDNIDVGNIDHIYEYFDAVNGKITRQLNNLLPYTLDHSIDKMINFPTFIFALNGSTSYTGSGQYFYLGKILYDGKVVRDYIPCSYNGEYGLWDKVEWKFYANAGSGNFTLGPEVKSGIYSIRSGTNLVTGLVGGGLTSIVNGEAVTTGNNSDTYFYTLLSTSVNTTSKYLIGCYVEGWGNTAGSWIFRSPQSNTSASLIILRDGWNWSTVLFTSASNKLLWDDASIPTGGRLAIKLSNFVLYKLT